MYKVKFDTGEVVSFQNEPTDKDIEDVVKKLGIKPKSASVPKDSIQATPKAENTSVLQDASQLASGAGKGVISTAKDTSSFLNSIASLIPQKVKDLIKENVQNNPTLQPLAVALGVTSKIEPAIKKLETSVGQPEGSLTKTTSPLETTGFVGEKVAEFLNPEMVAGTAASLKTPLTLAAEKLYQSALKPKNVIKEGKVVTEAADIVKTGLQERVWLTKGGVERVANKIDDFENALGEVIASAKSKGAINVNEVVKYVDEAKKFFQNQANVGEAKKALAEIESIGKQFRKEYGAFMPIEKAQEIKVATGQALRKYYDKMSSADIEATKQIVRGLKEKIVEKAPQAGEINKRLSSLYQFDQALSKASNRIGNLNLLGLGTKIGAAAGGSKGALVGVLADLADSPAIKSGAGIALNELSKVAEKGAIPLNVLLGIIRGELEK